MTGRPFWAILKPSGVTGNGRSLNWLSCHNDNSNRLVAAGRLLLIVIVMMLLLMQIDAENNTEYRAVCRNDTADQRNDSHRASPLPLGRGTTEVPPGFRERAAFLPVPRLGQDSLVPVYQSSTGSARKKKGRLDKTALLGYTVRNRGDW